jgi:hypothetical protein
MKMYFRYNSQPGRTFDDGDITLYIRVPNIASVDEVMRVADAIRKATGEVLELETPEAAHGASA